MVLNFIGRKGSKCKRISTPRKSISRASRNLAKIYCISNMTSPIADSIKRYTTWKSTPKYVKRKPAKSHRGTFWVKKSDKKRIFDTHAKSQFTYQPTRSQVTAATMKGTLSPQSTAFIGSTRVWTSNKKYFDGKHTWEDACRALVKSKR